MILFMLAIFIPYINSTFEQSSTEVDTDIFSGNSYTSILLNIPTIMFWTFGLNKWINLIILLPMRIILGITLWFIISPAK